MLRYFFFNIFFYTGVIVVMVVAIPALIMPNNIILWLGKVLGNWAVFCLKFFLKTKIN